jgi:cobalt-zinc-cadmium efflux system protein
MLVVALSGFVVNTASAWILHSSHEDSINLKGAYLHVLGDLLGTLGTTIAALSIVCFHWYLVDPIASIFISILIGYNAFKLIQDATHILLEGSPSHINVQAVQDAISQVPGVLGVHDLHIWTITSGQDALTIHVIVEEEALNEATLGAVHHVLRDDFGLHHMTVQLETKTFLQDPCSDDDALEQTHPVASQAPKKAVTHRTHRHHHHHAHPH